MSEEIKPETKKRGMLSAIFRIIMTASFVCLIAAVLILIIVPFVPFHFDEYDLIRNAPDGTLVINGAVINGNIHDYALFLDGTEMIRLAPTLRWTLASSLRFNLESPHYMKVNGSVCRVIYTRESLVEPFRRSCTLFDEQLHQLSQAFTDGHQKVMDTAKQTKTLYEKYRTLGLVE